MEQNSVKLMLIKMFKLFCNPMKLKTVLIYVNENKKYSE